MIVSVQYEPLSSPRLMILNIGIPLLPAGPVPITIGILEIISTGELAVTAVYTASDGNGGHPSIDVARISPHIYLYSVPADRSAG